MSKDKTNKKKETETNKSSESEKLTSESEIIEINNNLISANTEPLEDSLNSLKIVSALSSINATPLINFSDPWAKALGSTQFSGAALSTIVSSLADTLSSTHFSSAALSTISSSLADTLSSTHFSGAALSTISSSLADTLGSTQFSSAALSTFGSSWVNALNSTRFSSDAPSTIGSSYANALGSTEISSSLLSMKDTLSPIKISDCFNNLNTRTFSVGIDTTTLANALKTIMPYKSTELFIDRSVSLDDTSNNSFFFSDTNTILNDFICTKEISNNIVIHNTSNITKLNSFDVSHFSLDLDKYNQSTFLVDASLLETNGKNLNNYIDSKMSYIKNKNINQFSNDENQIISISSNGTELINSKNNEAYIIEDICLVDDIIGIEHLTRDELVNFYRFIYKYPMLAMDDDYGTGKKIYNLIKDNYITYLIKENNMTLYRARKYEHEEQMPYSENDVYLAPYGVSRRGRFNSPEMNHLYLSTDLDATLQELGVKAEEKYAILKCTPRHEIQLFDLTRGEYSLQNFCLKNTIESNKKEYIFPNFISNCCRRAGYEGIKYRSVKNSTQINYVLFEHSMGNFETIEFCDYIIDEIKEFNIRYTKLI